MKKAAEVLPVLAVTADTVPLKSDTTTYKSEGHPLDHIAQSLAMQHPFAHPMSYAPPHTLTDSWKDMPTGGITLAQSGINA